MSPDTAKYPRVGDKIALAENHWLRSMFKFTLETEAVNFLVGKIELWKGRSLS